MRLSRDVRGARSLYRVQACAQAKGTNGAGHAVSDFRNLGTLAEFSVSMWASTTNSAPAWTDYCEIAVPATNTTGYGYELERNDQHSASCYNESGGRITGSYSTGSAAVSLENAWHHLVMVYAPSTAEVNTLFRSRGRPLLDLPLGS